MISEIDETNIDFDPNNILTYYYENKTFKSNITSSINNYIKLEKYINETEKELIDTKLCEFPENDKIIKIENTKYFILLTYNLLRIYDNNGLLILEAYNGSNNIILLSKNIMLNSEGVVLYIEYTNEKIPVKISEKIRFQNYFFYKMEWIKNENILVTLFNKALYIYKITDINNFKYNILKGTNLENYLSIIFDGLDDDFLKNFNIDLIFNKYN